ncbi:MAG: Replication initiator protein A (RepA) N-terminus [Bacteriophage sp.]|nr:MAG: Replication initiator protein A (RepA) N-terminus [Bacteriophage sp.]
MAFLRKEHKEKYTCISNDVFRSDLSLKARGMLCTMLSLPNDWEFSENGLQAILKDGQTSIRSAIKELESAGFLSRTRERDENGRMGKCVWIVCDYPRFENPNLVNSNLGNEPQLSTKQQSTNKPTTKESKRETRHKYGEYQNVLLSDSDMEKLKTEFPTDWEERIERLSAYMASSGKSYKNHLATIRNWARRDRDAKRGTVSRETSSGFDKKVDADYYYQSTGDDELDKVLEVGKYAPKTR